MKILNDAVMPEAPELTSLQADAFFDFDKYFVREDAQARAGQDRRGHDRRHADPVPGRGASPTRSARPSTTRASPSVAPMRWPTTSRAGACRATAWSSRASARPSSPCQTPTEDAGAAQPPRRDPSPLSDASRELRRRGARPAGRALFVCPQRRPRSRQRQARAPRGHAPRPEPGGRSAPACAAGPPISRCATSAGQSGRGSSSSQTSVRL